MASDQLLKICMICMVTMLSLAMPSQQQQQQPSLTNDTMPADVDEVPQYPENLAPESGGYSLSSDSQYTPPPPPAYINALAPEQLEDDQLLSPEYSPSPSPYFQDLGPDDQITQYPSPPYIQVEAPEVSEAPEAESYELYSPLQAPSPAPFSGLLGSSSDQLPSDAAADDVDDVSASPPPVLPFNYRAEDESADEFERDYSEAYSEQSKNRGRVVGFVLGAVCLVGLAGFVFSKKKYNKPRADYEYELAKREDL